jgi:regulatory protein
VSGDPLELALGLLDRRDLSRRRLDEKLAEAGIAPDRREAALDQLAAAGVLSDDRFAGERVRVLAARGASDAAIRADLARQGVSSEAAERALASLEPEAERAMRILERRGSGPRTFRYLAGKGFSLETLERLGADDPLH